MFFRCSLLIYVIVFYESYERKKNRVVTRTKCKKTDVKRRTKNKI